MGWYLEEFLIVELTSILILVQENDELTFLILGGVAHLMFVSHSSPGLRRICSSLDQMEIQFI